MAEIRKKKQSIGCYRLHFMIVFLRMILIYHKYTHKVQVVQRLNGLKIDFDKYLSFTWKIKPTDCVAFQ